MALATRVLRYRFSRPAEATRALEEHRVVLVVRNVLGGDAHALADGVEAVLEVVGSEEGQAAVRPLFAHVALGLQRG